MGSNRAHNDLPTRLRVKVKTNGTANQRLWLLIVVALAVPLVPFAVAGELPGERWLEATSENALLFGAVGAALLMADVLAPVPSSVVGVLLGARLGLVAGFAWALGGLILGSVVGYALGRLLPGRWAQGLQETPTLVAVALSRPVPVLAEAVAIAAGARRVGLGPFVISSALGNTVYAGAMAATGASLLAGGWSSALLVVPIAVPALLWWWTRADTPDTSDRGSTPPSRH